MPLPCSFTPVTVKPLISNSRLALHLRAAKTFTPPALRLLTDLLDEIQSGLETRYRR